MGGQVSTGAFVRSVRGRSQYNTSEGLLANSHLKLGVADFELRLGA